MQLSEQLKRQMDRINTKDHNLSIRGDVRFYRGDAISYMDKNNREIKEGEWVLFNNGQRLGLVRYFQKRAEYKVVLPNSVTPLYTLRDIEVVDVEM